MRFRAGVLAVMCSATLAVSLGVQPWAAADVASKQVPPKKYVHSVCQTLKEWVGHVKQNGSGVRNLEGVTDLVQVKTQVVTFFGNTVDATDQLLQKLNDAGAPAVKNGSKIANEIKNAFAQVRELFASSRDAAQNLDPNDPAQFSAAASSASSAFDQGSSTIDSTFNSIDRKYKPRTLDQAFNADSACKSTSKSK